MARCLKIFIGILILTAMPLETNASNTLQIRGSDTMLNLVQKMAEIYINKNSAQNIAVIGGGSGVGISGLRNRTVDIANVSREITGKEIRDLESKGVQPTCIVLAKDCVAIIINKGNKAAKLTTDQLGAIFRGEITNWKDVGGDDMEITLYGRQSNSGTYFDLREFILKGEYSVKMRSMNGSSQIIEAIKTDLSGIGYVGRGYAANNPEVKVVRIAAGRSADYINPLELTASNADKYPISRGLNQYMDGKPQGAVRDFITFELSDEGQKICEDMGFFKISEEEMKKNKQVLSD
jgi:phosphate transport system substrate-binding protein